jgi:flagellar hook-associated protein 1 FlgK
MSKRTIQLSQKALDISAGNMGNTMTPGYSRQRVDITSMHITSYKNWQTRLSRLSLAGQGANGVGVAQLRNPYLDKRFREMNSHLATAEKKAPILEEIQTTLDNFENVGMEGMLARFKEALSKYGTNSPDNLELATIVRNSAFDITKMLNSYARDLDRMLEDNVFELRATVDYVNTLIERVATLNTAIVKEYKSTEFGAIHQGRGVSPYGPLELMDERNLILDELSTYVNIRTDENVDGSINVFLGDVLMIEGEKYESLVMRDFENFNAAVIFASNGQTPNFRSGEIRAYIDVVNGNGPYATHFQSSDYGIPYYKSAMDAFAEAFSHLMNSVNGVTFDDSHRAMFGSTLDVYDPDGNIVSRGPITAATIRISDEWMHDASMIGLVYNEVIGSVISSFSFPEGGGPFEFDVTLNGSTVTVNFDGTEADLQNVLDIAFPGGFIVGNDGDGNITISAENEDDVFSVTSGDVTITTNRTDVTSGGWAYSVNLDGNHVKELLLALDHPMKFGRALDFEGSAFDYVAFLSNRLGQGLKFLDEQLDTLTVTTNNLLDSRDAIMGVSTDEEGINMLIYQKWYNAAARMMTALDECLDRVINGMGRVGL